MKKSPKLLFGQLAVEKGYCTQEQLDEALQELISRAVRGDTVNLGTVLVEKNILTGDQVREILKLQQATNIRKEDSLFGKLAVYHEFCESEDIAEARSEQEDAIRKKTTVKRIGEILVKNGKLTPQQRDAIITLQFRIKDPDYWKSMEADWQRSREH